MGFERLELYAGKLARTVLRGGCGGNAVSLPDTQQAARYNSENALVVSGNDDFVDAYLRNWSTVSALGEVYSAP